MVGALEEARRERARRLAEALSEETGVPADAILGRDRDPEVVVVRHRLWRMLLDTGMSYSAIARAVGKNHATVMYGCKKARIQPKKRVAS